MRSSRNLSRISIFAALAAGLIAPAAAATLNGTVTYKTRDMNKPDVVASALVSVYQASTASKAVTRTNKLGIYFFKDLPSGLYVILVEKDGRRIYQGKVEVRDQGTRFDIGL